MLQVFTLKNGIKVATYSLPKLRSLALDLVVKSGYIFEDKTTSGLSHLMEHLLLEGTPTYPDAKSIANFIESIAGYYNAYTASHVIRFTATGPITHLTELCQLGKEIFFESLFLSDAVEKERQAILEEVLQRQDGLGFKLSKFFCEARYHPNHPYQLNADTQYQAIPSLSKEQIVNWWRKFFVPKNTYITLVGGFKDKEVKQIVQDLFGKVEKGKNSRSYPKIGYDGFNDKQVAIRFDDKLQSCYVDISFPSLSDENSLRERITQNLIRNIIAGLGSSRLYKLLRHERGLVYNVAAGAHTSHDFGSFDVSTELSPSKLDEVLELIIKVLAQFIEVGPTEDELNFVKNYRKNSALMSWDHPANIAGWIREDLLWEDKVRRPEEVVELVDEITLFDIKNLMKNHWDLSKLSLVIQGPIESSQKNITKYKSFISPLK